MSKTNSAITPIDRDATAQAKIDCDWIRLPLDTNGTTTAKVVIQGSILTAEQDVEESVTNTWDNEGWMTMSSVAGNPIVLAGTDDFARLDNLGSGQFIIAFDRYFTTNPTGTQTLISANPTDGTNGGWRINHKVAGIEFLVKQEGSGSFTDALGGTAAITSGNSWDAGRIACVFYVDGANDVTGAYFRKSGKTDLHPSEVDSSSWDMPVLGDDGIGVNCKIDGTGASDAAELHGIDGNTPRISNLMMFKTLTDVSGDIPTFLEQFWTYKNQVPYICKDW